LSAPEPEDERKRLDRLNRYNILDTPPEAAFDRITRIVAETIGVPIALVSLVDRDRQWFKSHHGLEASETPRDIAFCAHAILDDGVFIVEDASKDPRFRNNPLVTTDPASGFTLVRRSRRRKGSSSVPFVRSIPSPTSFPPAIDNC